MKSRRRSGQPNWTIAIKKGVITDTGVGKGSRWRRLPGMNIGEMRKDKKNDVGWYSCWGNPLQQFLLRSITAQIIRIIFRFHCRQGLLFVPDNVFLDLFFWLFMNAMARFGSADHISPIHMCSADDSFENYSLRISIASPIARWPSFCMLVCEHRFPSSRRTV